ncbi:MAG: hypothetical protein BWX80_01930 [Candidatus Hydrogenedentes bacterium ADurb.Bin101]|nr:MAG: hypothetical protein BWX80_01930 [Candidatus Hydrogenedentes bacterium ADurb.Bin101]
MFLLLIHFEVDILAQLPHNVVHAQIHVGTFFRPPRNNQRRARFVYQD